MNVVRSLVRALRGLFAKQDVEAELDDELRFHLEMEQQANERRGMSPQDAAREARKAFGGVERFKEEVRDERGYRPVEDVLQDIRYAARLLRNQPGFSFTVVLVLALGIGASTSVFSAVNGVLSRPLPYGNPDRLALLWHRTVETGSERMRIPAPDVAEYRSAATSFSSFAFIATPRDAVLDVAGEFAHARVGVATPNIFDVVRVTPLVGRGFDSDEAVFDPAAIRDSNFVAPPVPVVISYGLWQRRFGADPEIVGAAVRIDREDAFVVGVLRPDFELLLPADLGSFGRVDAWMPQRVPLSQLRRTTRLRDQDTDNGGIVIGRLADGVTFERARAEMDALAARQRTELPSYANAGVRIDVRRYHAEVVRHVRPALIALLGAVVFVLLVASLNAAGLLLARSANRGREIAIRTALGADRQRIAQMVLTESLLLGGLGGVAGLAIAIFGTRLLSSMDPALLPRAETLTVNGAVLGFALVATLAAVVLGGMGPAYVLSSRAGVTELRERSGSQSGRPGMSSMRRAVVVLEVAVSVVLLVGAGLMIRTFVALHDVRPGFAPAGLLTFSLTVPPGQMGGRPAERARLVHDIENRLRDLPGVESLGVTGALPLSGRTWTQPYGLAGQPEEEWSGNEANFRVITSDYLRALGTRLLAGRFFTGDEDLREEERVAIVDAALARRVAPDGNAVGERIGFPLDGAPVSAEIVGVVESVRHQSLHAPGRETIYVPYRQEASRTVGFAVRTSGDPSTMLGAVQGVLQPFGADLPAYDFRPMARYVDDVTAPVRFTTILIALFAGIAVVLATVGLYGLLSYTVSSQRRAIGIRIALGAKPSEVVRQFAVSGVAVAAVGTLVGLISSAVAGRVLAGLVFGVETTDLPTRVVVAAALVLAAAAASFLPARRASRVDPMEALRVE